MDHPGAVHRARAGHHSGRRDACPRAQGQRGSPGDDDLGSDRDHGPPLITRDGETSHSAGKAMAPPPSAPLPLSPLIRHQAGRIGPACRKRDLSVPYVTSEVVKSEDGPNAGGRGSSRGRVVRYLSRSELPGLLSLGRPRLEFLIFDVVVAQRAFNPRLRICGPDVDQRPTRTRVGASSEAAG
jgi:hypothetical protein